ncbi:sugar kinase [Flavobacterium beibuense]|uniref:PfkB domain protein n=1 Tax=Flavobacterium beibuense TaxID=657326 RepID=A0A444WGY6_9FLAO|nr:sugar kinase [Flavobacterium beibuense]RYJ44974.1 PfkB domain protein [Flavobacterium beibuense]
MDEITLLQNHRICCFGEVLLRFALKENWVSDSSIPYYIGGAELNVATALALWDIPVNYLTALPDNYIGKDIGNQIRHRGINTDEVFYSGNRLGIYYLPYGTEVKNNGVVYDRDFSSFSQLTPGTIDWDRVFEDCTWFHFSAISPALNKNIALICKEAVTVASAKGITISVDLNYRNKLWKYGELPDKIMPDLVSDCNVIMGNIWAVESLLGIPAHLTESKNVSNEKLNEAAVISIERIQKKYQKVHTVALTYRLKESYFGVLQKEDTFFTSNIFENISVTDSVGSGDCFMAGLIYGICNNLPSQDIINFAAAAAVGKLAESGDATNQSVEQIKRILSNAR